MSGKRVNSRMITILLEWLFEVHIKFKLSLFSYYLTMHIVDEIVSSDKEGFVTTQNLQLLGCCVMHIACKHEEEFGVEVNDWVFICEKCFTCEDMVKMEQRILQELEWKLVIPTLYTNMLEQMREYTSAQKEMCCALLNLLTLVIRRPTIVADICESVVLSKNVFNLDEYKNFYVWKHHKTVLESFGKSN